MYGKEIPQEQLQTTGNYSVTLSSCGNPDFRQDPSRSLPGVRKKTVKVCSMADASKACRKYIDDHELGGGNWTGGEISLDGKAVARVSYNGRVWELPSTTS